MFRENMEVESIETEKGEPFERIEFESTEIDKDHAFEGIIVSLLRRSECSRQIMTPSTSVLGSPKIPKNQCASVCYLLL
jgi:hypothetical protein